MNINPRSVANNLNSRLNNGTANNLAVPSSQGHSLITRSVAANYDVYKNGSLLGNAVATSAALTANTISYLRLTSGYDSGRQLGAGHGGAHLTPAQISSLYSILSTYMSNIGA
jgi:hypothetical protein